MAEIIVLGSGVAGLAAARTLSPFHKVTLLEERAYLGGIGETLSCKSGEECSVCSACNLPDLVRDVMEDRNIHVETGFGLEDIIPGDTIEVRGAGSRFAGDAIIVTTGMTVSEACNLPEFGLGRLDGVMTALDLDQRLRSTSERAGLSDGDIPIPDEDGRVAIVQCVCSRDTEELPYCSRVCCAYTARLALEVRRRFPQAKVTVFYMDLQLEDVVSAKQIATAMADPGIEYIRSRPAAIQGTPEGRLEVLFEDTLAGEIRTEAFSAVVLSTGTVPSEGTSRVAGMMGLATDEYGFIARGEGGPTATSHPGVFATGGATGPVDLVEASLGGMAAAAAVLEIHPPEWTGYPPRLVVLGQGPVAEDADRTAKAAGASTTMVIGGPGKGLKRLEGEPKAFLVRMGVPGGEATINLKADVIVTVPESEDSGPSVLPGADPYPNLRRSLRKGLHDDRSDRFVLLMGKDGEALGLAAEIMDRSPGARVEVLFREMAVAGEGMQELQMDLADRGVGFTRYMVRTLEVSGEGPYHVRFVDELSPELGERVVEADHVAAPPTRAGRDLVWPWFLSRYAPEGIPTEHRLNVLPVMTPRRGVYTAVPATRTGSTTQLGGAAAAATAIAEYARGFPLEPEVGEVDPDLCAACLNCLRICPHDAIVFNNEARAAVIMPRACQDCGLCASICPAKAINMVDSDTVEVA